MKKTLFIKDLREKTPVEGSFLVSKKESGISKAGKPYLIMRVMDSSGECEARVWDNAEELNALFEKNDVVFLRGYVVPYQGKLQINVSEIRSLQESEFSIIDYLPASSRAPEEMIKELDGVVAGIGDRYIKALLTAILSDSDVREKFKLAPAAKAMHHPYLGGLIEHVLSICGLVDLVVGHYADQGAEINRDLLIAGAILHDIGKIYELSYGAAFEYTDEGRLIGHITIGVELVDSKARCIEGFPHGLLVLLKHMLLSHHGTYEFGSPKRPKTMEAVVLSYLDDLDAKVNAMRFVLAAEKEVPGNWTSFQRIFERYIYKGKYLPDIAEGEPAAKGEPVGGGEDEEVEGGTFRLFK